MAEATNRVSLPAWFLAVFATLIIYTIIYAVHILVTGIHYLKTAELVASQFNSVTNSKELLRVINNGELSRYFPQNNLEFNNALKVINAIEEDPASYQIEDTLYAMLPTNADLLASIKSLDGEMQSISDEITKLQEKSDLTTQDYADTASRIKGLLVISGEGFSMNNLYTGGVLEGLPVLDGIPDNIPDSRALIDYIQGGVTLDKVMGEIAKIKSAGELAKNTITQYNSDIAENTKQLSTLKKTRLEKIDEVKKALSMKLISFMNISLTDEQKSRYNFVAGALNKLGVSSFQQIE